MKIFMMVFVLLMSIAFQGSFAPCLAELTTGLSVYLPLAGTAEDKSGNGRDVQVHGAAFAKDTLGFTGGAYAFDGKGNWLDVKGMELLINYDRNWSINFWGYVDNAGYGVFMAGADGDAGAKQFVVSSRYVKISSRADSDADWRVNFKAADSKTWHMYTVTWDRSGRLQVFVDGALQGEDLSGELADFYPEHVPLIGAVNFSNKTQFLHGKVGDFRLYDRVLTATEAKQLFNLF